MKPSGCNAGGWRQREKLPSAGITVSSAQNLISLGAPISGNEFCEAYAERTKANLLIPRVGKLEDRHLASQILRLCASSCKLVHLMCNTPPQLIITALGKFDQDLLATAAEVICVPSLPVTAQKQAQLRPSFGGLGFAACTNTCFPAYLSSMCSSNAFSEEEAASLQHIEAAQEGLHSL